MKYFISVGEPSGDLHAAALIGNLSQIDRHAEFSFLGGDKMTEASGITPVIHIDEMSVMGFAEVLRKLPRIFRQIDVAKKYIASWKPDAVILVDYPSFNLKIAKYAHSLGIKVFWYISPKVWVWKEYRVKAMKKYIDRLFCILPFEPDYFADKHGWTVRYVGNPSAEEILECLERKHDFDSNLFRINNNLPFAKPLLALLPGSRRKEIESNLPVMVSAAKSYPCFTPVIARVGHIEQSCYDRYADGIHVVTDVTFDLLRASQAALVTSGTAVLETALLKVPQVMLYRHSGSKYFYTLFRRLLKVKYFSLPNLINDSETVPELVMHFCTPEAVSERLGHVIPGGDEYEQQQQQYSEMAERLGNKAPAFEVAKDIYETTKGGVVC